MTSREDKLRLLAAVEEKRLRRARAKPLYVPNEGQLVVHKSDVKERFNFSANGAGKTTLLVQEVHAAAHGYNPWLDTYTKVPAKIVVIIDNSSKIAEVFIPEYRKWFELNEDWCKRQGKPYVAQILFPNGSQVSFYTVESDPMQFEGFMADYVFIDEPLPKPLMTGARRSLRIKGSPSKLLFCGTAVSQPWLRREVYEPWSKGELAHVECFRTGIEVNRANLDDGYIERFASGLSESEKETRLRGGWFDAEGLALAHLWDRKLHIIPDKDFHYDRRMPCVVAIDPHAVKPHHAVMITADPQSRLVIIKETSRKLVAREFASHLKEWTEGYQVIQYVVDSFGSADATSFEGFTSFIDSLRQNGIPARPTTYDEKDAEDAIDRIRTLLALPEESDNFGQIIPKLRALASCKGCVSDIETVGFQKNRLTGEYRPKLDTTSKDYLSCISYALATGLFYDKPRKMQPYRMVRAPYGIPRRRV